MFRHGRLYLRLAAFLALSACSDDRPATTSVTDNRQVSASLSNPSGQLVAAGIAQALANSTVRRSVLQAFRASPWVEHKLVLQEFITTTAGGELVAAAAAARGVTPAEFTRQINALPLLDFYVSSRLDRLSWRGEGTVGVALSTTMAAPLWAHTSEGTAIPFASARVAGRVLVALHPVEVRGRRMKPQASVSGSTIQDADDVDIGIQFIQMLSSGDTVVHDLQKNDVGTWVTMEADGSPGKVLAIAMQERERAARATGRKVKEPTFALSECSPDPIIPCEPEGGGGTGGGPPQSAWTNVTRIQTRDVCDWECGPPNEFEFRARAYNANNVLVAQGTARIIGVDCCSEGGAAWIGSFPMLYTTVAYGVTIHVDVVETDIWPNPDDNFDPNPVLAVSTDNGRRFQIGPVDRYNLTCAGAPTNPCTQLAVDFGW